MPKPWSPDYDDNVGEPVDGLGDPLDVRLRHWFASRDTENAHALAEATGHPAGSALRRTGFALFAADEPMTAPQYARAAVEFRSRAEQYRGMAERLRAEADMTAYAFLRDRARHLAALLDEVEAQASAFSRDAADMADSVRADDARDYLNADPA